MKRCPYCGELIMSTARKCRYCGSWLDGSHGYDRQDSSQVSPVKTAPTVSAFVEPKENHHAEAMEQKVVEPEAITTVNNIENKKPNNNEPAEQDDSEVEYDDNGDPIEEESTKQQVIEFVGILLFAAGLICFGVYKFSDAGNALLYTSIGLCLVGSLMKGGGTIFF